MFKSLISKIKKAKIIIEPEYIYKSSDYNYKYNLDEIFRIYCDISYKEDSFAELYNSIKSSGGSILEKDKRFMENVVSTMIYNSAIVYRIYDVKSINNKITMTLDSIFDVYNTINILDKVDDVLKKNMNIFSFRYKIYNSLERRTIFDINIDYSGEDAYNILLIIAGVLNDTIRDSKKQLGLYIDIDDKYIYYIKYINNFINKNYPMLATKNSTYMTRMMVVVSLLDNNFKLIESLYKNTKE